MLSKQIGYLLNVKLWETNSDRKNAMSVTPVTFFSSTQDVFNIALPVYTECVQSPVEHSTNIEACKQCSCLLHV